MSRAAQPGPGPHRQQVKGHGRPRRSSAAQTRARAPCPAPPASYPASPCSNALLGPAHISARPVPAQPHGGRSAATSTAGLTRLGSTALRASSSVAAEPPAGPYRSPGSRHTKRDAALAGMQAGSPCPQRESLCCAQHGGHVAETCTPSSSKEVREREAAKRERERRNGDMRKAGFKKRKEADKKGREKVRNAARRASAAGWGRAAAPWP